MIGQADTSMPDKPASQPDVLAPVEGLPEAALVAFLLSLYKQYVVVSPQVWRYGLSLISLMCIHSICPADHCHAGGSYLHCLII